MMATQVASETPPDRPRVSVVMGVYNAAEKLRPTLASIRQQSLRDLELIVVDDGSTDATPEILAQVAREDARVRILRQENAGLTAALIRGCEAARGALIARQDAEDWSLPERLEQQVALLDQYPEVGLVCCTTAFVGPRGEVLETQRRDANPEAATEQFLTQRLGPPAHGSVVFRRELYERVGGYRSAFFLAQDSDLWLRMIDQAQVACSQPVGYVYVLGTGGLSAAHRTIQHRFGLLSHACRTARLAGRSENEPLRQAEQLTAQLTEQLRSDRRKSGRRAALASAAYLIGSQLTTRRDAHARRYLGEAIRHCPWRPRPWLRLLQSVVRRDVPGERLEFPGTPFPDRQDARRRASSAEPSKATG